MSDQARPTLEEIVSLAKRRGFIYPSSSIYGGLANSYDFGPLGAELIRTIRNLWWESFVHRRSDMIGLDSQIMQHPQVWVASGHVDSFADPLVEDTKTGKRFRADHLIEGWIADTVASTKDQALREKLQVIVVEDFKIDEMAAFITEHGITSPEGNPVSAPRQFNLLFETAIGTVSGEKSKIYLRGETAQGIFINFKNILDSTRVQLPFGVGQIGKSFRNEITTGQFIFRTLELEQAEIEYFFDPEQTEWEVLMADWKDSMWRFITKILGVREDSIRWRRHTDSERSFYSKDTYDLDYHFPFGWKELWGVAYRTDYDLKQHMQYSGQSLEYTDPHSNRTFVPHVIEPALGVGRAVLMVLTDAYWRDEERQRIVLRLKPSLAPYKAAVFPLLKNKPELVAAARDLHRDLQQHFSVAWDDRGNIGKRYLAQDEIGTPVCITVDFQTLEDGTVTIRDRDTAEQRRVHQSELESHLRAMVS